jgi:hypothetical protein
VPPGNLFMMNNRDNSNDSLYWGRSTSTSSAAGMFIWSGTESELAAVQRLFEAIR